MGRIFAVTSGKGGTGKSTVSVGLAAAFAADGKRVLLMDLDEGLRCLDLLLGVDDALVFDLADILNGRDVEDAVYPIPGVSGLSLIPAPGEPGQIVPEALGGLIASLEPQYDVLLLDFPAGIDFRLYEVLPPSTRFLTVCGSDPVSVRDAAVVTERLPKRKTPPALIVNRFSADLITGGKHRNLDDIIDQAGLVLIGIVPQTEALALLSVNHQLKRGRRSMNAFERIAKRLNGESVPLPRIKKI